MKFDNILYYTWNEVTANDMIDTFQKQHISFEVFQEPLQNLDEDEVFEEKMKKKLQKGCFSVVFSFNYFPVISHIAMELQIPYVSWVYDCPHTTLYSDTITNPINYVFLFDREMAQKVCQLGAEHVFHLPLGVNTSRLDAVCQNVKSRGDSYDVSFVGSLYEDILYDQINYIPEYERGYLEAIMQSQQDVWGENFPEKLIDKKIAERMDQYIKLGGREDYHLPHQQIYADLVNRKITQMERKNYLTYAAEYFTVDVFTGSQVETKIENMRIHEPIDYVNEMPIVFASSKINLNISLRSIQSGIPLRCLDILGAGGFLMTNYQPELFEFFEEGIDFVCFQNIKDMLDKIHYYLNHEEKRKKIAQNGWRKLKNGWDYINKIKKIEEKINGKSL